jgi:hypothetical protein
VTGERAIVVVVLRVINRLVGVIFDHKIAKLKKGLTLMEGKSVNSGNGEIRDW